MDWLKIVFDFLGLIAKYEPDAAALIDAIRGLAAGGQLPAALAKRVREILPDPLPTAQALQELAGAATERTPERTR